MAQGKHNTVHKYGSGKRKRSKQLANARAKKRKSCVEVEPLTEISDNKKIRMTNMAVILPSFINLTNLR